MVDLALSLVVILAAVAVGLLALGALTLLPLVVAAQTADRLGRDAFAWGAVTLGCALAGLGIALLTAAGALPVVPWTAPAWTAVLPLACTWLGPALLLLLPAGSGRRQPAWERSGPADRGVDGAGGAGARRG